MGRAPCCDKANVKKGPWSPEEDATLKAYIENYGTGGNWIALPQKIGLKRCGKSCRLRWLNYLRPNIKHGGFTEEEDNIICSLYISIGSRWSIIAAQLPGRTDNDIKNYWNTRLKKKLLGKSRNNNNKHSSSSSNNGNIIQEDSSSSSDFSLSNSALERLQLHMHLHNHNQTLQNPFSNFSNNPALRPPTKLNPFPQKQDHHHDFYKPTTTTTTADENIINSLKFNIPTPVEPTSLAPTSSIIAEGDQVSAVMEAELHDIILDINRTMAYNQDQMCGLDYLGSEILNDSKDSFMMWWSNEFDAKSASSNSCPSTTTTTTTHVLQPQGMFQDNNYEQGIDF